MAAGRAGGVLREVGAAHSMSAARTYKTKPLVPAHKRAPRDLTNLEAPLDIVTVAAKTLPTRVTRNALRVVEEMEQKALDASKKKPKRRRNRTSEMKKPKRARASSKVCGAPASVGRSVGV